MTKRLERADYPPGMNHLPPYPVPAPAPGPTCDGCTMSDSCRTFERCLGGLTGLGRELSIRLAIAENQHAYDARDAARYRWLRSIEHDGVAAFHINAQGEPTPNSILIGGHLDEAIDKAMDTWCPTCDKCKKPIETGAMAIFCEHGEQCELAGDNWESIKDFRDAFGVDPK